MPLGDQAGDITKSVTEGFRGNPLCLAVVVLVAIVAVFQYFKNSRDQEYMQERYKMMMQQCFQRGEHDANPPGN